MEDTNETLFHIEFDCVPYGVFYVGYEQRWNPTLEELWNCLVAPYLAAKGVSTSKIYLGFTKQFPLSENNSVILWAKAYLQDLERFKEGKFKYSFAIKSHEEATKDNEYKATKQTKKAGAREYKNQLKEFVGNHALELGFITTQRTVTDTRRKIFRKNRIQFKSTHGIGFYFTLPTPSQKARALDSAVRSGKLLSLEEETCVVRGETVTFGHVSSADAVEHLLSKQWKSGLIAADNKPFPLQTECYDYICKRAFGAGQALFAMLSEEMLEYLCTFLSIWDIEALIGSCHYLRTALTGINFYHRVTFTQGPPPRTFDEDGNELLGNISVGAWLDGTTPVVNKPRTVCHHYLIDPTGDLFLGHITQQVRIWDLAASVHNLAAITKYRVEDLNDLFDSQYQIGKKRFCPNSLLLSEDGEADAQEMAIDGGSTESRCGQCTLPASLYTLGAFLGYSRTWTSSETLVDAQEVNVMISTLMVQNLLGRLNTYQEMQQTKTVGQRNITHVHQLMGNVRDTPLLLQGATYKSSQLVRQLPWMHIQGHLSTSVAEYICHYVNLPGECKADVRAIHAHRKLAATGTNATFRNVSSKKKEIHAWKSAFGDILPAQYHALPRSVDQINTTLSLQKVHTVQDILRVQARALISVIAIENWQPGKTRDNYHHRLLDHSASVLLDMAVRKFIVSKHDEQRGEGALYKYKFYLRHFSNFRWNQVNGPIAYALSTANKSARTPEHNHIEATYDNFILCPCQAERRDLAEMVLNCLQHIMTLPFLHRFVFIHPTSGLVLFACDDHGIAIDKTSASPNATLECICDEHEVPSWCDFVSLFGLYHQAAKWSSFCEIWTQDTMDPIPSSIHRSLQLNLRSPYDVSPPLQETLYLTELLKTKPLPEENKKQKKKQQETNADDLEIQTLFEESKTVTKKRKKAQQNEAHRGIQGSTQNEEIKIAPKRWKKAQQDETHGEVHEATQTLMEEESSQNKRTRNQREIDPGKETEARRTSSRLQQKQEIVHYSEDGVYKETR